MPALRQLLVAHGNLLVLDAAAGQAQVAVLRPDGGRFFHGLAGETSSGLFRATEAALAAAGRPMDAVGAFVYCEGPGSMLGIRTAAMAIRTWQVLRARPAFAYRSLALAGIHHATQRPGQSLALVADARRDTWHLQTISAAGAVGELRRVPTAELPSGELLMPQNFRMWSQLDRGFTTTTYDLATLFSSVGDHDLFRAVDAPDAFQHEAPEYKKWSAQVHSAATAPRR